MRRTVTVTADAGQYAFELAFDGELGRAGMAFEDHALDLAVGVARDLELSRDARSARQGRGLRPHDFHSVIDDAARDFAQARSFETLLTLKNAVDLCFMREVDKNTDEKVVTTA